MEVSIGFVCALGIGTVFIGLICIVILCKIIGLFCGVKKSAQNTRTEVFSPTVAPTKTETVANRGEIVAAISAAIAEELGTDVTGIKILSIKKV